MTQWMDPNAKALVRAANDSDPYGVAVPTDTERLDWLERATAKGRTFQLAWYGREKSTVEDSISYDVPAGFYVSEDDGPYPTLRAAIDAVLPNQERRRP